MIWEKVLLSDFRAPSPAIVLRLHDPRVSQYWDKGRLLSRAMGEKDRSTMVWDYVAIYQPGASWEEAPPKPVYHGYPVEESAGEFHQALRKMLGERAAAAAAHSLGPMPSAFILR